MKFALFVTSAVLGAASVFGSPIETRQQVDDATILNYALTLEHLENAFYSGALAKYDQNAFVKAGLPPWARKRFVQVGEHEDAHVKFLAGALGDKATKPCEYKFPYTDPKSFAALAQVLEGVGVSAYAGAAALIQDPDYLTAAAVVLSTEARHAAWIESAVNKHAAWSGPLDTPLGLNEVYTLAAQFITSCPSTNPTLPVKAFAGLTFDAAAKPGQSSSIKSSAQGDTVVFYTGLSTETAKVGNGKVTLPAGLQGTVYAVLKKGEETVAGPAILRFDF